MRSSVPVSSMCFWGLKEYPAGEELWGPATKTPNFDGQTAVRVPYASMEVIQTGFPDGG